MPDWLTRWRLRMRATLSPRHDRELRDELQLHLHLLEEEYTRQGMPPDLARRRAYAEFGNATLFQEASHDLFSFRGLEDVFQDLTYALREMRRSRAFTAIAVLSLACGIGATTSAFTIVDAFIFRGLPVHAPDRLVAFSTNGSRWGNWPYVAFTAWRDAPGAPFQVAAASDVTSQEAVLRGTGQPADVHVTLVSTNYFQVMGADIAAGRPFADADGGRPGSPAVAVISDAFWQRWFGGTPDVLAKTLTLHGVTYDVVGVARRGFTGHYVGHPSDVWIPLTMQASLMPDGPRLLEDRWGTGDQWLKVIGRLGPGVSVEQAATSAGAIRRQLLDEKAAALGGTSPQVTRERTQSVTLLRAATGFSPERARYGSPVMMLAGICGLVLVVACANFTNLMLARSEGRRREFIIRLALGGGRWRIIRQAATECLLLAVVSALLGLLLAGWATAVSVTQFAIMITPVDLALDVNLRVLLFTGACVALVIAFGLWPCVRAVRTATMSGMYQPAAGAALRTRAVAGRAMLIAQLSMCTVLLISTGLLLRTVTNLRSQDLGFDRNVLLVSLSPGQAGHSDETGEMLIQRVRERLAAVPGILATGASGAALLDYTNYWIDGSQQLSTDQGVVLPGSRWTFAAVGPGFFEAVGMPLVTGRAFDDRDAHPPADVVVINRSLATVLFANENPIGRRMKMSPRAPMQTVVGVVNDASQTSPRDRGVGVAYLPLRDFKNVLLAVRTTGRPADFAPLIRHQLDAVGDGLPIGTIRSIAEVLDGAIAQERLMSAVSLSLGAVVVAIGCVGLYALMAYDVARRTRELGIRLALGATSGNILTMVVRDGVVLILPALAIGLPIGVAASRPLSAQLYGVQSGDPWTLASVALVLAVVAVVATLSPARTASRIDPIDLLRNE